MTKSIFLQELGNRLRSLPADERNQRCAYYEELLSDMMEDGMDEEAAVAKLGNLNEIVTEILQDTPFPTLVKNKLRPKHGWTAAAILVAILGAPLWLSLLLALVLTVLSLGLAVVSIIVALFLCVAALGITGILTIVHGFALFSLNGATAVFSIGFGFVTIGLVCLSFLAAKYASIGLYHGVRWLIRSVKRMLISNKEA